MLPVALVDEDVEFCRSLASLIQSFGVGASTFNNPTKYLRSRGYGDKHVALINLDQPDVDGLDVLRASIQTSGATAVFALLDKPSVSLAVKAIKAGAQDVLEKPFSIEPVLRAANNVGNQSKSPSLRLVQTNDSTLGVLSRREVEVFDLLLDGSNAKEIGERLGISSRTAEVHRRRIYAKLDVSSQIELVKRFSRSSDGKNLV